RYPRAGTNQRSRGHVGYQYLSLSQFCDSEIEHLNEIFSLSQVTAPVDHDVLWLDVSMNYSFYVRSSQRAGDLYRHIDRFVGLDRPARHPLAQRHAIDKLSGDIAH